MGILMDKTLKTVQTVCKVCKIFAEIAFVMLVVIASVCAFAAIGIGAKALALTALDLILDPALLASIKEEHRRCVAATQV